MATPETKAKKKLKDAIKAAFPTSKLRSNAAGGVGFSSGTVDFTLYADGVPFDIEVKAGDNTPTPLQVLDLKSSFAAGVTAVVLWADRPDEITAFIDHVRARLTGSPAILRLERSQLIG